MKSTIYIFRTLLVVCGMIALSACDQDFPNPNAPTDEDILNSEDGLISVAVGIRQLYSTSGVRFIVETPAITTREAAITTTFQNMIELEDGGTVLPNDNSNVEGLWSNLIRVIVMCDNIIDNAPRVEMVDGTRIGLISYAHLFKAMSIGALSQSYEQVVTVPDVTNNASFVPRAEGFATAIQLLVDAQQLLTTGDLSNEFMDLVLRDKIDLTNSVNAMLARYQLFAGNYTEAITAASAVDMASSSVFSYDAANPNPIWNRVLNGAPNFKPRDNFGLPSSFTIDPADGRVAFYQSPLDETNQNGLPYEELRGFFTTDASEIPLYLPGEMQLIIAEAQIRKSSPDLGAAVTAIDAVRTKSDDPLGVNANLAAYSGDQTAEALLLEIYQNRRLELALTGVSLEDSRRFGRPQPSGQDREFDEERNRNFYPYPLRERNNNDNTPADPSI